MSVLLPEWLLVISLVLLLAFTTWTTLEKGISQYKKETKEHAAAAKSALTKAAESQLEMEEISERQGLLSPDNEESSPGDGSREQEAESKSYAADSSNPLSSPSKESREKASQELHSTEIDNTARELALLLEEEKSTPQKKAVVLSGMVVVVIALNLLKGGSGKNAFPSPLGVACGSSEYWLLTGSVLVFVLGVSVWAREELLKKWRLKKRLRYKYIEGDVEWNEVNTLVYPCFCFFAGFFAGTYF